MEPYLPDADRLSVLRTALPATGAGIYLDTLTAGPLPAETAHALAEADEWDLRTGRAGRDRAADVLQRAEEARGVLAALVGGDPDQILLTHGLDAALELARRLAGARPLEVIAHVDATTGAETRLEDALQEAASRDALVALDAGASAGVLPIDVDALGVSFVAIPAERWLLGPEGIGALWVSSAASAFDAESPRVGSDTRSPRRAILGFARSVGWLEMYVGLPWIYERTARLAAALNAELAAVPGVEVLTPLGTRSGIVAFSVARWSASAVIDELGARSFAILGDPPGENIVRVSFGAFNSEEELTRLVATVALLAAHTPESLPRRPGLMIISNPGLQNA